MLLCFDYTQRKLGLFESHKHNIHGGVIAVGQYDDRSEFMLAVRDSRTRLY